MPSVDIDIQDGPCYARTCVRLASRRNSERYHTHTGEQDCEAELLCGTLIDLNWVLKALILRIPSTWAFSTPLACNGCST
jgi:hypothetical protein